jgi:hypothetical protein
MYSSSERQYPKMLAVEPLLRKYQVDVAMWGHTHFYERTRGISRNGEIHDNYGEGTVHVTHGTAGALVNEKCREQPDWSAKRFMAYGFGVLTITDNELLYEFHDVMRNDEITDSFSIKKK